MVDPIKTKTKAKAKAKKISTPTSNKIANRRTRVKRGLRKLRINQYNSNDKISDGKIKNRHFKKRKKSPKKTDCRNSKVHSIPENSKIDSCKRSQLHLKTAMAKKKNTRKTLTTQIGHQEKGSDKGNSLNASIQYLKNLNLHRDSSQKFIYLCNLDKGKRYKNKFRKPASGKELKRLRNKLWNKSSYHKRFLEKTWITKGQKNEKKEVNKTLNSNKRHQSPTKEDINLRAKLRVKNLTFNNMSNRKKKLEPIKCASKSSGQHVLGIKKDVKANLEIRLLDPNKPSKEDVSTVDEKYLKSLLCIANRTNVSESMEFKHENKNCYDSETESEGNPKMTGKEFFEYKLKIREAAPEFTLRSLKKKTLTLFPELDRVKNVQYSPTEKNYAANPLREATKSEMQIKLWDRKAADNAGVEVKSHLKKAHSKHEITSHQQKKKTRYNVKNKTVTEMPFPRETIKTEEIQELWKRENSGKCLLIQSGDSSSTIIENGNNENVKGLGMESYQVLKRFVEEEVYRISQNHNVNSVQMEKSAENRDEEMFKKGIASPGEKQLAGLVRKKLAAKNRENVSYGEKVLQNPENLNLVSFLHEEKPKKIKSKLKFQEDQKSPDDIIKNWSIVNRLEQAFLALGTPCFQKTKGKENPTTNAKGARTFERNKTEVKKVEKKVKDVEKSEKKPVTCTKVNKQKEVEVKKGSVKEKPSSALHNKESTTSSWKIGAPSTTRSTKPVKADVKAKPKEEKVRSHLPNPAVPSKQLIKPVANTSSRWGTKSSTHDGNIFSSQNKVLDSRQIGKLGKKNSSRNNICESSKQNKNDDDNLERKTTFHIISLKDSVMQPRRSKSYNKIDRNSQVDRKNSVSSAGSQKCKNLNFFNQNEQNQDFWDFFNKTEKMKAEEELKNKEVDTDTDEKDVPHTPKCSSSKDIAQTIERSGESSEEIVKDASSTSNHENEREKLGSTEHSKQARVTKDVSCSKARAIKERSILSIRTNKYENQSSRTNISQIQECAAPFFQTDNLNRSKTNVQKDTLKADFFLPPTNFNYSQTSCASTATYDLAQPMMGNYVKSVGDIIDDKLELLKEPSMSSSQSIQIISSQLSTDGETKLDMMKSTPWEKDINYYRALVTEIMSQYKRLDGCLKHSERLNSFSDDSTELKMSSEEERFGASMEELDIQEYRKKIVMEYQEVPIFEYKIKMQETHEKSDGRNKGSNLLVVQPGNVDTDLDVKDYEPSMKTILGSPLYFDRENFTKRQEINKNPKEKKSSLEEMILCKYVKRESSSLAITSPKSCLCSSDQTEPDENDLE